MYVTISDSRGFVFGHGHHTLCQVCGTSGETYWAYFPNPPFFILCHGMTPASRFLLMTLLYWGARTIPYQWASFNYSARSFSPPLCLSWNDGIACLDVQLTTQISSAFGS
jgi:hypothetical protein